jgi:DNA polymerase/3'-5' exonuclease PolX
MAPACQRIEVAGSIRRRKPQVKDIELVLIPRWTTVPAGGQGSLLEARTAQRNDLVELLEREVAAGREILPIKAGGHEIEPAPLRPDGRYWRLWLPRPAVKVDVFLVDRERWGLIFMIRTGSGVGPDGTPATGFAPAMLARWKRITRGGYSREGRLYRPNSLGPIETREEEDVFRALRMAWVPPEERTSAAAVERAAEVAA